MTENDSVELQCGVVDFDICEFEVFFMNTVNSKLLSEVFGWC